MKETIRAAIKDALGEKPSEMADKINSVLFSKVSDAFKTKKMEISNRWLNDIESSQEDDNNNDEAGQ
jgi:hypothetical protein